MIAQLVPVIIAVGANLGARGETIRAAHAELAAHPALHRVAASPLRESVALTPHGPDPSAPGYLNGVLRAETGLDAHALLDLLQAVERRHGRTPGARWADRPLDLDLIVYGGRALRDERLTVPHPAAHRRDFVLSPWLELEPDAVLPGHGRVDALLARLGDTTRPAHVSTGSDRATP